jgi:uncharacterized protein
MNFEKTVTIQAPIEEVWNYLWDVERLKSCIPVCKQVREVEPQKRYEATIADKVGPFTVCFDVQVEVTQAEAFSHIQVKGSGKDTRISSHATGTADVWLCSTEAGTQVKVASDFNILGKLGGLGRAIIIRKADEYMAKVTDQVKLQLERNPLLVPAGEPEQLQSLFPSTTP